MQPQFSEFQDRLRTFELWRGKRSGDPTFDDKNYAGKFKVEHFLEYGILTVFIGKPDF